MERFAIAPPVVYKYISFYGFCKLSEFAAVLPQSEILQKCPIHCPIKCPIKNDGGWVMSWAISWVKDWVIG
jgi:hypothetical protein